MGRAEDNQYIFRAFSRGKVNLFTLVFNADKTILQTCLSIAENYTASGGSDTLIVAWTKKQKAVLLTLDDVQARKAQNIQVECYDLTDSENRQALLARILN